MDDRFSLLDRIPLGVCVLRPDWLVAFWNCILEDWTEIPRDRILGKSICEFFPHLGQPLYANRLTPIFAGGPPTIFSSQLHKHLIPALLCDGRHRVQHATVTAIPADEGEGFYAMLSLEDVTDMTFRVQEYRQMRDRALVEAEERKLAQERAETANRVKDEFLAIVSHELRTPLNPIVGFSRLLRDGKLSGAKAQTAIETIARNAALQVQLIDDLLDMSRILRGKVTLHWQKVDLAFVVRSAMETVRLMAENKGIAIDFQNQHPAAIRGDATRLQQVVWNLLTNAIKFTPAGGRIEIWLRDENQQTVLSVKDTGVGIAPEFLPLVFESFRQADGSTTRKSGGLGLGLAIARHLVELQQGKIEAYSAGVGQGSTFTIELPQIESKSPTGSQPPAVASNNQLPNLTGKRILIVDDEADTRDLVVLILQESGATAIPAASVAEAIAAIDRDPPDLIVSDLAMPDADGFDLIKYVRSRADRVRFIPAIALTAYAAEATQQQTLAAGFQQHLVKPIDIDELVGAASCLMSSEF